MASFLTPNRTVLLVSDDALYIYSTSAKDTKLVEVVPWEAQNFAANVAGILAKDCGKKPVLLLNDMVEQHYRKERVLKTGVSTMDRSAMLKRRLSVAFGKYSVRAALPLKEKIAKTATQPASDIYIFAAIPDTEQLEKSMAAVKKSMASISGLCLLPVESADMVKTLSNKLTPKGGKKAIWSILVGQHQSGSLRQVVTKNGELALTRMSPISAKKEDAQNWAAEVNREFKATMSYLSRFGYSPEEGLDVTMIAHGQAAELLQSMVEEECNLNVFDAFEAAKTLGLKLGRNHDPGLADALHIAWAGRKSKMTLPMRSGSVDKVHKPRQIAMAATFLLFLGVMGLGYQFTGSISELTEINDSIDTMQRRKTQLDQQYQQELARKEAMGFDVKLIQSAIAVYDDLEAERIDSLPLFKSIGRAMGKDMRVDRVELERADAVASANPVSRFVQNVQPPKAKEIYHARLIMTYPGTTDIDRGNREVGDLRDRLARVLPDNDVEVTKFLKDYEYTEGLVVETGDLEKENLQQDFVAEILIKGLEKQEVTAQ